MRAAAGGAVTACYRSEGRREPVRGVRRQIVEHLTRAHREIPAVTYVEECDFTDVDLKLLLPLVLRATAQSLQEFPELNARLEGDEIVYLDRYDLGVAVQTDQGLVVPVVRGCDTRPLDELRADVDALAEKARAGKLAPEELRGSTFTVTSAGKLAGLFVTPLVNHPEVGHPRRPPDRAAPRRARRRGRRALDRERQRHVRPPRRRRRPRGGVHPRRDRPARAAGADGRASGTTLAARWGTGTRSGSSSGSAPRSASPPRVRSRRAPLAASSPPWPAVAVGLVVLELAARRSAASSARSAARSAPAPLVAGALRRGGTRGGTAALLGASSRSSARRSRSSRSSATSRRSRCRSLGAAAAPPRARHARGPAHARARLRPARSPSSWS